MTLSTANAPKPTERVLATLNADGSRRWLRPKPSLGRFLTRRRIVAFVLILLFTLIPYLKIGGRPLMLLDIAERRFTLFGVTFLPTDTVLLALFLLGIFLTIFLLTALLGRVWCGWGCPQTVYLEFVYRPIERLFEGSPGRSKRGIQGTALARVLKYACFFVVSCYLAHTFLAYFVGVDRLAQWVQQSPADHVSPFLVMAAVTGLMMFDFMFFREQTCTIACPYGRFQSVLLDRNSLIVGYDRRRGEPRGKAAPSVAPTARTISLDVISPPAAEHEEDHVCTRNGDCESCSRKDAPAVRGDCVDCGLCVATCPTGIDIRDGLQMECIHCAQCIDACDAVMIKLNRSPGLIRYASQATLGGEPQRMLRARVIVYPALLLIIVTIFSIILVTQSPFNVTAVRGLGRPYTEQADGMIENPMKVKITNRQHGPGQFEVSLVEPRGSSIAVIENPVTVAGGESVTLALTLVVPPEAFAHGTASGLIRVTDGQGHIIDSRVALVGPTAKPASSPEAPRP